MGRARAPVVGSGRLPACRARVSKPNSRSDMALPHRRVGKERNVQSLVNGITCAGQLRRGDPAQARSVTNVPWVSSKQRLIN